MTAAKRQLQETQRGQQKAELALKQAEERRTQAEAQMVPVAAAMKETERREKLLQEEEQRLAAQKAEVTRAQQEVKELGGKKHQEAREATAEAWHGAGEKAVDNLKKELQQAQAQQATLTQHSKAQETTLQETQKALEEERRKSSLALNRLGASAEWSEEIWKEFVRTPEEVVAAEVLARPSAASLGTLMCEHYAAAGGPLETWALRSPDRPFRYMDMEQEMGNGIDARKMTAALISPAAFAAFYPGEKPEQEAVVPRLIVNALNIGVKELAAEWALAKGASDKATRGRAAKVAKEKAQALVQIQLPPANTPGWRRRRSRRAKTARRKGKEGSSQTRKLQRPTRTKGQRMPRADVAEERAA